MTIEIDFCKYTSIRIGGVVQARLLDEVCSLNENERIIGAGCNLLVSPTPPPVAVLSKKFDYILMQDNVLEVGAATSSATLFRYLRENDLGGLEFIKSIPGQIGGLVFMNAGLVGFCMSDNLTQVLTPRGWQDKDEFSFGYRHSGISEPIFAARFLLLDKFNQSLASSIANKRKNQPRGASFGSCFKNPDGDFAGRLIEAVGLKGFALGGVKFSEMHANFLINFNNASFFDTLNLISLAKKRVLESFGIELQTEVCVLQ